MIKPRAHWLALWVVLLIVSPYWVFAQEEPATDSDSTKVVAPPQITITDKWSVLVNPGRPRPGIVEFTDKSPIQSIEEFKLLGPSVGHPYCLGEFVVDGHWALNQGVAAPAGGKNTLLSLATADEFELEGIINQEGLGGWLMLLGWNQGHGYSLSNVTFKDSGAPWFLCEYRAAEAIVDTNEEVKQFEWRGDQPFRMTVKNKLLSVIVGKTPIVEEYPLENYTAGEISLGTYDTRYGPRPLKVRSLRIRALGEVPEKPKKGAKPDKKPGVQPKP